jgi:hypothetical protein
MKVLARQGHGPDGLASLWVVVSGPYADLVLAWRAALEHRRAADGFYIAGEMGSPQDG